MGKAGFSNSALVQAIFEAPNNWTNCGFEATKPVPTKTLFLKALLPPSRDGQNLASGNALCQRAPSPSTNRTYQHETPQNRHRVNGVGRGGGQPDFNQIPWNPVKIRLKSGWNPVKIRSKSLEIMCFQRYKAVFSEVQGVPRRGWKSTIRLNPSDPICIRPHLPGADKRPKQTCTNSHPTPSSVSSEEEQTYTNSHPLVEDPSEGPIDGRGCKFG